LIKKLDEVGCDGRRADVSIDLVWMCGMGLKCNSAIDWDREFAITDVRSGLL